MAEAEGAAGAVQSTGVNIGKGLTQKIGPLPLWGWLAVAGVGIGAYFLFIAPSQQGGGGAGSGMLPGDLLGGGGGGGGGSSTATATGAYVSNTAWAQAAAAAAATQLGIPLSEAINAFNELLAGQRPQGSNAAQSLFDQIIQAGTQAVGQAPSPLQGGQANPYTTTNQWLLSVLAFLPTGTSTQVIQDITNVINGTSTTLTQAESDALQSAINIIGEGPTPITYTLSTNPQNQNIFTAALVATGLPGGTAAAGASRTAILQSYFPDLTAGQASLLSEFFHVYGGGGGAPLSNDQAVTLYNSWLSTIRSGTGAQALAALQKQLNYYG